MDRLVTVEELRAGPWACCSHGAPSADQQASTQASLSGKARAQSPGLVTPVSSPRLGSVPRGRHLSITTSWCVWLHMQEAGLPAEAALL